MESCQSKEILVHITDAGEKATMQLKFIQEPVESIWAKAIEVVDVSHLPNDDLRIFTHTAEAKESLQADQMWLQQIGDRMFKLGSFLFFDSVQAALYGL